MHKITKFPAPAQYRFAAVLGSPKTDGYVEYEIPYENLCNFDCINGNTGLQNNTSMTGYETVWYLTHFSIFSIAPMQKESKLRIKSVEAI